MSRCFVETRAFQQAVDEIDGQELLQSIQNTILKDPEHGDLVKGTGGVRKMRAVDEFRKKGKRGGFRVLYLDLPHASITALLMIYGKNVKLGISSDEKKIIKEIVEVIKKEVER